MSEESDNKNIHTTPPDDETFNLYTEKIVEKKSKKYKKLISGLELFFGAVLIGVVSCFTFYFISPYVKDIVAEEETRSEFVIGRDDYPQPSTSDNSEGNTNGTSEDPPEDATDPPRDLYNNYEVLRETMLNAKRSVVKVTAMSGGGTAFQNEEGTDRSTAGLIIANIDSEYIILTNRDMIENSPEIYVEIANTGRVRAYTLNSDEHTKIAAIGIRENDLNAAAKSYIRSVGLDNSYVVNQGDIVIAAGKLQGNDAAINFGITTNVMAGESAVDNYYGIMATNIIKSTGDYVFLFNTTGNAIGIMKDDGQDGLIHVYGISDLKILIEKLSNRSGMVYLGIIGKNVTNLIAEENNLPMGIYITEVVKDSPAFNAGIQAGDVITRIGNENVMTFKMFSEILYEYNNEDIVPIVVQRYGKDEYRDIPFNIRAGSK